MSEEILPRLLLSQRFTSFEELAALAVAWDLDFRQISKSNSASHLEQIQAGNILFSHLSCGCFATHAGETPKNMCTISLPDAGCPDFRFFGRLIDRPELIVSPAGQEFNVFTRPGYGISTFSISNTVFDKYCETNFDCPADKILESGGGVIPIGPEVTANLRAMARQLSTLARAPSDLSCQFNPVHSFESQVLESLCDSLQREEPTRKEPGAAVRNRMLKRALEFIGDNENEPLNVRDLSATVATSERTLRRLFNREFGVSPKKYLFGHRMYGAHRQLWQSSPSETRIVDVANVWGFWHMGQFARDYRGFFGELPSETLNGSSTTRSV
ncbi:MAG: helix-turn-helix domain-containing protein [Pseudomonadota bacterium]